MLKKNHQVREKIVEELLEFEILTEKVKLLGLKYLNWNNYLRILLNFVLIFYVSTYNYTFINLQLHIYKQLHIFVLYFTGFKHPSNLMYLSDFAGWIGNSGYLA